MSNQALSDQSDHEREIANEEKHRNRADDRQMAGTDDPVTDEAASSNYDQEVEAEREGTDASGIAERGDEEEAPIDSAYRPRSG